MKKSEKFQQSSPKPMNSKGGISEDSFKMFDIHFHIWFDGMYGHQGYGLNRGVEKYSLCNDFLLHYPVYRPMMTVKRLKSQLLIECDKAKRIFNPHRLGWADNRDKSGGKEYYVIADANFNPQKIDRISMDDKPKTKKPGK